MINARNLRSVFASVIFLVLTHAQSADLPTEVDTLQVGRTVVLLNVRGEILRKGEDGSLSRVDSGDSIDPGVVLLVRSGASFSIGGTTFGPEHHGDRWIRFE